MRCWGFWVCVSLVLADSVQGFAKQPAGPRTLEGLLNSDDAKKPAAAVAEAAEAGSNDAGPKRPAGTVARPKDGVQHPDLDKAWATYESKIAETIQVLSGIIQIHFEGAAERGDLEQAEKWKTVLDAWQTQGQFPNEPTKTEPTMETRPSKPVMRPPQPKELRSLAEEVASIRKSLADAKRKLQASYEARVKMLTMDKDLDAARKVKDELLALETDEPALPGPPAGGNSAPGLEREALSTGSTPVRQPQGGNALAAVKLARDKISGDWERLNDDELVVHNDNGCARLCLPVELPNEYEVRVVFTRNWGNQGFGLFATRGEAAFLIQLSAVDGQAACLNEIRGGPACSVRSPDLGNGRHELVVAVRDQSVSATFDNRLLFKQKTDYTNFTEDRYGFVGPCRLGLISWFNDVTFHRVELRNLAR